MLRHLSFQGNANMHLFGQIVTAFAIQASSLNPHKIGSVTLWNGTGDDNNGNGKEGLSSTTTTTTTTTVTTATSTTSITPPPPTPCTRICRYNADFYDGQVCIGCFREVYEISNWDRMSNTERMYALMDAGDRAEGAEYLEGAIDKEELERQASAWGEI